MFVLSYSYSGTLCLVRRNQSQTPRCPRRDKQHLYDTRSKAKTRTEVEKIPYSVGDIVMMREVGNLNRKRDSNMVVSFKQGMVEVRKLGAKMRLETYEGKEKSCHQIKVENLPTSKGQRHLNQEAEEKQKEGQWILRGYLSAKPTSSRYCS